MKDKKSVSTPTSTTGMTATESPGQERVDPSLTLALAQASLAAYAAFDKTPIVPPANYRLVGHWSGWDGSIFGGSEEPYGLLFQSTLPEQWKTFIFAFRGTDSDMDIYEDLFFETTAFVPTRGEISLTPYVAAGFYDIYNDLGGSMTQSMRNQLFALLDLHQPRKIYITGHSLGAALCQLFSLDVAVSRPDLWAANLNFSSPMVGTDAWKTVYESQPAERDPARHTVRVFNYWDYVPSLPPSRFLGYTHVGCSFRTSFYVLGGLYPHELARHSILNLQTVLRHAVWQNPQTWIGTFHDATDLRRLMQSDVPPTGAPVKWADRLREERAFEQTLRESEMTSGTVAGII